ncbi:MAG: 30S ribosomal protein S8 [bacterium]|nr:30S ribosomal protein S8 [bacterium]
MVADALSDAIIRIKNGYMARKESVVMPKSKVVVALCEVLVKNGYLSKIEGDTVTLVYTKKVPAVTDLDRISKPGLRIYVNKNNIPTVVGGRGIAIISTPAGLLTDKEAKKQGLGGELLCKIW